MNNRQIVLKNVSVHNLKNVNLTLNPFEIIVFTGVSGSGKSSLAFDTIFQEGQRRYIETLEATAKRYIKEIARPEADLITGLSPTIAIEQKTVSKTPRSTVGTITGIYDFLRVLFAKIATAHCPISNEIVKPQSKEEILKIIEEIYFDKKIIILSPFIENKKSSLKDELLDIQKKGFSKVRVDKKIYDLSENISFDQKKEHTLEIITDRIKASKENLSRLKEAIFLSLEMSKGSVIILDEKNPEKLFSEFAYSKKSNTYYNLLKPQDFSFNHPSGMCDRCQGLGLVYEFDIEKIINPELSISEDCCIIAPHYNTVKYKNIYDNLAKIYKFSVKIPWKKLPKKAKDIFLFGIDEKWVKMKFYHPKKRIKWSEYVKFKGIIFEAHQRLNLATSDTYRKNMQKLMTKSICPSCLGSKLKPFPSFAEINGKTISEICAFTISESLDFFNTLKLTPNQKIISEDLIKEIVKKLNFLMNVGLHYLTINRISPTLSGGESQRVKLATQIGSDLSGTTYVLDEPSIGLHPFDHSKLIDTFITLKKAKNTIIIVEHDKDTIEIADTIVDIGPKAGKLGGKIIAKGNIDDIIKAKDSLTGKYLSYEKVLPNSQKRKPSTKKITLTNCLHNNLKKVNLTIPLNTLTCITGVSGSGKSSLISDTLFPALSNKLQRSCLETGKFDKLTGDQFLDKVIYVDQSPIGRTIRSNPATYTKLFDDIRYFYSELKQSKVKGFTPSSFSFNVKEGTCQYCRGLGFIKIDLDFMEEATSKCLQCDGKRFSEDILSIYYKDKNIYDILNIDITEAIKVFDKIPKIRQKLDLLEKVGLGYMSIGQSATTLSGGEAQRIKLAKELIKPSKGHTLYILDEPTTGLHFYDIEKLMGIIQKLISLGNTVIIIEHNMDLVKMADWIIDLGPKGGKDGGKIIFEGTVDSIIKTKLNTGQALKKTLKQEKFKTKPKNISKDFSSKNLIIKNAYQNNLKNISLEIPHGKTTVFTGPSGSGKTSLAFDTIYQDGQIKYMEALDIFSKQFLSKTPRPQVENIKNMFPPISLQQKSSISNPRSTIGTISEIYDYLRVLYAQAGVAYCPKTNEVIRKISPEYVTKKTLLIKENEKIQILSPIDLKPNEKFIDLKNKLIKLGFLKIRINKTYYDLEDDIAFNESIKNDIAIVIDRLKISEKIYLRLLEAIKIASKYSGGKIIIDHENVDIFYNLSFSSEKSAISYPSITPKSFSFNSDKGMCLDCQGLGFLYGTNILDNIDTHWTTISDIFDILFSADEIKILKKYFNEIKVDIYIFIDQLSKKELDIFLKGSEKEVFFNEVYYKWKGINTSLEIAAKHSNKFIKESLIPLMEKRTCPSCQGTRLNPLSRNVKINNLSITDFCSLSLEKAYSFIKSIKLNENEKKVLSDTLSHIEKTISFLIEIGLHYISLDRSAPTLSGGEMQRIRLAKQLGSYLTSCIYILDEPTIGLHPHNTYLLSNALKKLKDLNNTLILVEHDKTIIAQADYIVDFGPKAGVLGGEIIAKGTYKEFIKNKKSLTAKYLNNTKKIPIPTKKRNINNRLLKIKNASLHNLKNISIDIPLNAITCITGVSGSGKSTLINGILKKAAISAIKKREDFYEFEYGKVTGLKNFSSIIALDQSPVGQTNRADVGTYSDIMPLIRAIFANLILAKTKGLYPRHFSYNHLAGMCRNCWGIGHKKINLQYLPPLDIVCDVCKGFRLNPISLEVKYKNKHLGNVLDLTIEEAKVFFDAFPKLIQKLDIILDVGLGYLKLGQELNSLSGGEAGRLKLAKELAKKRSSKTLYIFDEPSIGLHFTDIENLLQIFHKLADKNNTLIIVEHNLDVIANSDYIIDIGKDAGEKGGNVVFEGTTDNIIKHEESYTGRYLNKYLLERKKNF